MSTGKKSTKKRSTKVKVWSTSETETVAKNYKNVTYQELLKQLPGRSMSQLKTYMKNEGLLKRKKHSKIEDSVKAKTTKIKSGENVVELDVVLQRVTVHTKNGKIVVMF